MRTCLTVFSQVCCRHIANRSIAAPKAEKRIGETKLRTGSCTPSATIRSWRRSLW
eukprot:gene10994-11077_t